MTEITIRQVQGEEIIDLTRLLDGYAFSATPPLPAREAWAKDISSYGGDAAQFALFEDGTAAAYAASSPMQLNVRGHLYPSGGVWGVTTHPTARRKGYARQMLHHLFTHMHAIGQPFSILYPFRESFYDRLGYTTFPQPRIVRFSPSALLPLLKKELPGQVEMVEIAKGFEEYYLYLQQMQAITHGMALTSLSLYELQGEKNDYWLAIARIDGEIVGLMRYRIQNYASSEERFMQVRNFFYSHSQGKYLLLEWFARHADQVKEIELKLPPGELPETWFPDLTIQVSSQKPPMGRIIDVAGIAGMQTGPGEFSAQISDPQCPWNNGNYRFATIDGILHVTATSEAECELTIQALSALVYGTHDPESFAIRDWGDPAPDVQASMRSLFPAMLPYLHEVF